MDQDATWYGGMPRPRPMLDGDPDPTQKRACSSPPLFDPYLSWPNGWMDQDAKDATWYEGRPRPRRHCDIWGPSSPYKVAQSPTFRPMSIVAKRSPISAIAELLSMLKSLLWSPYVIGQTIIFSSCFFFFLLSSSSFFSSPNLSGRRLDVYRTLAHGVALVRI